MFLYAERRRQPMHVGALQLYTPPPDAGPDFVRELVERWRKVTSAVEPFNLRARFRVGHWFWEEDRDFEVDYHLRHSALPRPGRVRELLALVSRLHGALMDRTRPLWEMHVIEGLADGRIAAYCKVHHALFDGVAAIRIMQAVLSESADEDRLPMWAQERRRRRRLDDDATSAEPAVEAGGALARGEPDAIPGPTPGPLPVLSPTGGGGLMEPLLGALRIGSELLPGIRSGLYEIVRSESQSPADARPFHAPPTMFNVNISGSRRFAAQSWALSRFRAIGKATGTTINDVTLAVCAGALRRYLMGQNALPAQPLIAMVPVSVRAADQEGGNQIAMLLANLSTHVADPLERLRRIHESTALAKKRLGGMTRLEQIAHAATMGAPAGPSILTGHARRRPIFNLIISNVPGPPVPLYMNGMRLDENYPVSIPVDYMALNITINSYCEQLGFGFIACRRSVPTLQRMLDTTDEAIAELELALGLASATASAS
jgi:diacylglycerol O-acyltransferase